MRDGISLEFGGRTFEQTSIGLQFVGDSIENAWDGQTRVVAMALRDFLNKVAGDLATTHGTSWPGGTTDKSLSKRTGKLVNSILRSVDVRGTTWEDLAGTIGGSGYLAIHEYGGTIKARGKLLTIPLPAALSKRGTSPPFARQWKNTFVARSKAGNLIIFQKRGREIVPLYVLKSSVYIPPRLGMRKAIEDTLPYFHERAIDRVAKEFSIQVRR